MGLTDAPSSGGSGGGLAGNWRNPFGPRPSNFDTSLSVYDSLYGPEQAYNGMQHDNRVAQLQSMPGLYGDQASALRAGTAAQQAQLGLQQRGNAAEAAGLGRQSDYYSRLYGLDQRGTATNIDYQNRLRGFLNQSYGVATGVHGSVLDQLANQAAQARYTAGQQGRAADSQATAAGAFTSAGHRQTNKDIAADLGFNLANNTQQVAQENLGYKQTGIERSKAEAGIDNTIRGLSLDLERSGLTTAEQQARLGDRRVQLGIQSQIYGLQSDQMAASLQQGLAKLNLDQSVSMGQLFDAIQSNNMQSASVARQVIEKALAAAGALQGSTPKEGN